MGGVVRSIRTIRNIPRLKDISFILIKHGLHQMATTMGAPIRFQLRRFWPGSRPPLSQVERLRHAFEELGPLFIKLGQFIASRPDLFPVTMVQEFEKLQDQVDALPYSSIREVLVQELGGDPSEWFRSIDEKPLASASMAQVHRATTLQGEEVILKVQKPRIEKIIDSDLEILELLADALTRSQELQPLDPAGVVAEVRRSLLRELDFTFERYALDRVRKNFDGDPVFVVPRTFPELSTRRLLVMEYLEGSNLRHVRLQGREGHRVARESSRILFEMIFRDGYFHADPHPGNVILLPDGRIGWIDFGSMGLFTQELRTRLVRLLRALFRRDYRGITRQVLKIGRPLDSIDNFRFAQDVASRLDPFFGLTLKELDVSSLFNTILELARDYRIHIAPGFVMMTRSIVLMEGLAHRLDPDFDAVEELEPVARRYFADQARPDRILGEMLQKLGEALGSVVDYPQHFGDILRRMSEGRFGADTHVQEIDKLGRRLETSSNRVVNALIVSALLISSSLIVSTTEFTVVGIGGFVLAALIGLRILWAELRT